MKTLILLLSVLFTTMSFAQVPSYVPANGLVGWWPFNGNANDESGNGNNGTVNGATLTTDRNGVVNSAYNFSGTTTNTEIITGDCSSFPSGNSPRSISIWYYGINTSTTSQQLFGYGGETCGQSFIMNFNNPDLGPTVNPTGKYEVQGHCQLFRNYASSALPLDNYWHQIILTYDGSVFRFYNDGNLVSTSSPTTLNVVTLSKIYCFGKETNQSGTTAYFQDGIPGFNGKLDDIGIWNRALTDCEIQNLYTSTNPSNTTTASACGSYAWNGTTYTSSGVYTGTTTNCVTEFLNLTITPSSTNTTTASACDSYTWNGQTYSASGVYTDISNCVTESLNLTITPSSTITQPASQSINISNNVQFIVGSSGSNSIYQWQTNLGFGFQNLNNAGQYNGTTSSTLSITNLSMSNNNQVFRCIISSGSCTDTSDVAVLTVVNNVGFNDLSASKLSIYPNPTNGDFTITGLELLGTVSSLTLTDMNGKVVKVLDTKATKFSMASIKPGVYFLNIISGNKEEVLKIVKE